MEYIARIAATRFNVLKEQHCLHRDELDPSILHMMANDANTIL